MYYEIKIKHTIQDAKGNDKDVTEGYIVKDCELFAEAERKGIELFNNDCEVVAVKRSPIEQFINGRGSEEDVIFAATLSTTILKENGTESKDRSKVGLWSSNVTSADKTIRDYLQKNMEDTECEEIKKTSFVEML